ncbi:SDR family NAD(P)-dependent oxidoreductase [Humidisolicoccus flavus]|uniref:SDR family NAD(P)-dependent oxidoreductase n=1 Tax=Humidisolicoccus flavus TaxID=3111414 RepID=UPI00324D31A8
MRYTALITGASGGLGTAIAHELARSGVNLILVARREAPLRELQRDLERGYPAIKIETLAADILDENSIVEDRVRSSEHPVDILVNNAGRGLVAEFSDSEIDDEVALSRLLYEAPMRLTHAAVPGMLQRRRGWVLNVASMAAFTPSGSYSAAKSALVMLSRSLNARLRPQGVHVTALCPGFVETDFHDAMGVDVSDIPKLLWSDPEAIAKDGIRALRKGRSVVVSDWRYRLLRPLNAVLPDSLVAGVSSVSMSKTPPSEG